ncbi:hypothetical protein PHYSODRAFT_314696 [Phytophthora sojae]|uniref:Potassium channel tetramerisation-type BTB domain-containing protein n=1 Tax=Phytophthora sojae (strain P6497) TaxID=1094619 RepID=G4ZJ43_PHYSP|nr:hypothetical protein PHYSODRAFT_314696 [Phytophthora sojae]EGZ17290.1 hypothetical protein PHYSODRAFT_314696 [Phytophthora sojae]|eukprot:XP_009526348.1 hypothetical protein PHYSODRAFT_314696 [Phytophthora sojae]
MLSRERLRRELEREWALIESAEKKVAARWISWFEKNVSKHFSFLPEDSVVVFNVGGQLFKSTVKVWTRDRFSILAQLCTTAPKLRPDTDQSFFFDRDFWVFRLIVAFLRDSTLPESVEELRELYCEASFYRLGLLRHAIEARMIGEDAVAANELQVRLSDSQSAPVEAPAKVQDKPSNEDSSPSIASKYSELPDPFGFTSKK